MIQGGHVTVVTLVMSREESSHSRHKLYSRNLRTARLQGASHPAPMMLNRSSTVCVSGPRVVSKLERSRFDLTYIYSMSTGVTTE